MSPYPTSALYCRTGELGRFPVGVASQPSVEPIPVQPARRLSKHSEAVRPYLLVGRRTKSRSTLKPSNYGICDAGILRRVVDEHLTSDARRGPGSSLYALFGIRPDSIGHWLFLRFISRAHITG
jgi:hypothetical protein